jgi:hypothetical protein
MTEHHRMSVHLHYYILLISELSALMMFSKYCVRHKSTYLIRPYPHALPQLLPHTIPYRTHISTSSCFATRTGRASHPVPVSASVVANAQATHRSETRTTFC